jgi:hypothetical protein
MSAILAAAAPQFVRRTMLADDEYRVNFKQIDNDIIKALVSKQARSVTPLMSAIYLGLLAAPRHCWEREGVLHFRGEDRIETSLTAWEQMRELAGVANSTLSKALDWMHRTGLIGYDARANGAGIRVFFNRAKSSIRSRPAEKILRLVPAPIESAPAPSAGMGFKEHGFQRVPENDIFRAVARDSAPGHGGHSSGPCESIANDSPHPVDDSFRTAPEQPALVNRFMQDISNKLQSEIALAVKRETDATKQWLLNHGIPKATRVAQRETFDLLRAQGLIAKNNRSSIDVGRNHSTAEKGREGKTGCQAIEGFLRASCDALQRAAAAATASGSASVNAILCEAISGLDQLHAAIKMDASIDPEALGRVLIEIENRICLGLLHSLPAPEQDALAATARKELRGYAMRMDASEFQAAVDRHIQNALHSRFQVPRLNLFYA